MTTGKMSLFGVGPWFVLLSAIYTVPAIVIRAQDPRKFPAVLGQLPNQAIASRGSWGDLVLV